MLQLPPLSTRFSLIALVFGHALADVVPVIAALGGVARAVATNRRKVRIARLCIAVPLALSARHVRPFA